VLIWYCRFEQVEPLLIHTMTNLNAMQLPATQSVTDRVEWAGERLADVAEGLLGGDDGWAVWATIVGWADLCSDDARRQYQDLAGRIADMLRNQEAA
jgi:hypothetical protein